MIRFGRATFLLVALALSGCEPSTEPISTASSGSAAVASDAAKALQAASEAKENEEFLDAEKEPWRPGESLLGKWHVTTPSTLALAEAYASQIAARPLLKYNKEAELASNLRFVAPLVTVSRSRIEVRTGIRTDERDGKLHRETSSREYHVLRDTGRELEIQLRGGDGERTVLTLRGDSEVHAPGLVDLAGGVIWRRGHRLDIGRP